MKTSGVYWIYQVSRDRAVYVGSSKELERRLKDHRHTLDNGTHFNRYLQRCWGKYGYSDFQFLILELCPVDNLVNREQFWMDALSPTCNVAVSAEAPNRGRRLSQEHRDKISESWKTRVVSDKTRSRISQSLIGKTKGRKRSPEQILKNSLGHKDLPGHSQSVETRSRISNTLMGHIHSEETKAKIGEKSRGRIFAKESLKKMSDSKKGVPWSEARRLAFEKSKGEDVSG